MYTFSNFIPQLQEPFQLRERLEVGKQALQQPLRRRQIFEIRCEAGREVLLPVLAVRRLTGRVSPVQRPQAQRRSLGAAPAPTALPAPQVGERQGERGRQLRELRLWRVNAAIFHEIGQLLRLLAESFCLKNRPHVS